MQELNATPVEKIIHAFAEQVSKEGIINEKDQGVFKDLLDIWSFKTDLTKAAANKMLARAEDNNYNATGELERLARYINDHCKVPLTETFQRTTSAKELNELLDKALPLTRALPQTEWQFLIKRPKGDNPPAVGSNSIS